VNPRERWQTLQSHLSAARGALAAGDKTTALEHIEAALLIDPEFLAARMLRDRVTSPEPELPIESPAPALHLPVRAATPVPNVSPETLASFEERIKQRVLEREAGAAAGATALPARDRHRVAAALAAAAVLLVAMSGTALYEPTVLHSRSIVMSAPLVDLDTQESIDLSAAVEQSPAAVAERSVMRPAPTALALTAMADAPPEPVHLPSPAPSVSSSSSAPAPTPLSAAPTTSSGQAASSGRPSQSPASTTSPVAAAATSQPAVPPPAPSTAVPPRPVQMLPPRPMSDATVATNTASAPVPAVVPALLVSNPDDRILVDQTLQRYRRAYNKLDARSAQAVYPAVNENALARAFDNLESQMLSFDSCDIDLQGRYAAVTCHGSSRYVPKIGNHEPRIESRVWSFTLRKDEGDWKIENARAAR